VAQVLAIAMLVWISFWVSQDAKRRGMNPRWGIGVGLLLILLLPVYLLVRRPVLTVQCAACGIAVAASLSVCRECAQPINGIPGSIAGERNEGRPGRIFG
jgi:hypothetical protein